MSDFIAQIKGELSLQDAESKMQAFLNKYKNNPLKIDININKNISNSLNAQMKALGKSASKAFAQGMNAHGFIFDKTAYAKEKQRFEREINKTAQSMKNNVPGTTKSQASRWAKQYHNDLVREEKKQYKEQERYIQKLNKYKERATSGEFESRSAKNKSFLDKYVGQDSEALTRARRQAKEIERLQKELSSGKFLTGKKAGIFLGDDDIIKKTAQLDRAVKRFSNTMSQIKSDTSHTLGEGVAERSANNVQKYINENTKALRRYKQELKEIETGYRKASTVAEKSNLDNRFKNLKSKISAEGLTGKSLFDELGRGFKQIGQFVGTYGLLQQIPEVITKMVGETYRVDDAITQLQMATNMSDESAKNMMTTYSQMGKELKATATDVSASATEWLKQGKSIAESQKLASDSIILSKIGDLSSQEATRTITAAMKSYKLSTSEIMGFIDQISAIDMASATDVGGLSQAFNEVAANAKLAGVETEKLLSYAAVIGETTQEGMASVGTSLNAIFTRMGNIKLSRLKDYNTGEDLSNVETVLRKNSINLRDAQGQFREFDTVLDETASKWHTFDSVTRRAVAQAFAG